jgi:GTP pyrophosphokinase
MSGGKGLTIHRKACSTSIRQRTKEPTLWTDIIWEEIKTKQFICYLRLEVEESPGVLAKIASAISSSKSNIIDISIHHPKGANLSGLKIGIEVSNRVHLAEVLRNVRKVNSLTKASRLIR